MCNAVYSIRRSASQGLIPVERNPYILINLLDNFILQDISRDFNHRFKSSRETFDMAVRLSVLRRSPSVRILMMLVLYILFLLPSTSCIWWMWDDPVNVYNCSVVRVADVCTCLRMISLYMYMLLDGEDCTDCEN